MNMSKTTRCQEVYYFEILNFVTDRKTQKFNKCLYTVLQFNVM